MSKGLLRDLKNGILEEILEEELYLESKTPDTIDDLVNHHKKLENYHSKRAKFYRTLETPKPSSQKSIRFHDEQSKVHHDIHSALSKLRDFKPQAEEHN
mgnify:CR=1 FL=1